MQITKELFKGKVLSDGTYPVMIRIYHNGLVRRVATSVGARERNWDKRKGRLSCRECDYRLKNEHIESVYRRVAGSIQNYIDSKLETALDTILSDFKTDTCAEASEAARCRHNIPVQPDTEKECGCFLELIDRKIETAVSLNTRRGYEGFRRYFQRHFGNGPALRDFGQSDANRFADRLKKDYPLDSSTRYLALSRFNAIVNFGKQYGMISPTLRIGLPRTRFIVSDRNMSEPDVGNLFDSFKEQIASDPDIKQLPTLSLSVFILHVAFQGLAPVDLASLKIKALSFHKLHAFAFNPSRYRKDQQYRIEYDKPSNTMEVVSFNTVRKKTGRPVAVVASLRGIAQILKALTAGRDPDEYLLPCYLTGRVYTPQQRQSRLCNFYHMLSEALNTTLDSYYKEKELGPRPRITYYFARHLFCNLADSLDVPRHIIQSLVGHRSSVLESSYLRPLTPWEQAKVSEAMLSRYLD